jgi:hypothetical protein
VEYIHIKSLEKFHPGYRDRDLRWAKVYFSIVQGDPEFELISNEIDKWRFIAMICLELGAKKPLPNIDKYWQSKGFDLKKRPMALTLQMLHNFLDISTQQCSVEEIVIRGDKGIRVDVYNGFEEATVTAWNSFCDKFPSLTKIKEVSQERRAHLKKRFMRESFRKFDDILKAIEEQPFLLNGNPESEKHKDWRISLDWLICNDTNYLKVLEHKYKDNKNLNSFNDPKYFTKDKK